MSIFSSSRGTSRGTVCTCGIWGNKTVSVARTALSLPAPAIVQATERLVEAAERMGRAVVMGSPEDVKARLIELADALAEYRKVRG